MSAEDIALDLPSEPYVDEDIALDVARPRRRGPAEKQNDVIIVVLVINNHAVWGTYYDDPTYVDDGPYKGDAFALALVAYKFVQAIGDIGSELAKQAVAMTKGRVTGFLVYEIIQMVGIHDEHTLDIRTPRSDIHRSMMV